MNAKYTLAASEGYYSKEECIDSWFAYNERLHRQIHIVAGCLIASSYGAAIMLLAASAALYDRDILVSSWMWSTVIACALIWSPPAICLNFIAVRYALYGNPMPSIEASEPRQDISDVITRSLASAERSLRNVKCDEMQNRVSSQNLY